MALFRRLKTPVEEDLPDDETSSPSVSRSAGGVLRQQRKALGLGLNDVAAALKIKSDYLAALEAGRLDLLPGPTYAIGFLRAYADHLKLDGSAIVRRFKSESTELDAKPDLAFPVPLGERSIPGGGMLLVALILALCGYGTWYYLSTAERSRPDRVTDIPRALLPYERPAGGSAASSGAEAANETALATPTGPVSPAPAPTGSEPAPTRDSGAVAAATPPSEASSAAATGATSLPPAPRDEGPRAYGAVDGPARIVIRATADSWIQIRNTDQSPLFTRVLKAGESYRVPDRPGVSMRTGNAGGLDITIDGKPAPPIGPNGAVRNLQLEPQALTAGSAAGG
jgi:cytoskeleton protein RodZ